MNAKPMIECRLGVEGFYTLERYKGDADGNPVGECLERLSFKNIITNTGMGRIFNTNHDGFGQGYVFSACVVGTGNTAPAVTDTQLASWLATKNNGQYAPSATYVAGPPPYWKVVGSYQFNTGVAAGNLTEIGIFSFNDNAAMLISRALVVDGSGNPTTIVVEPDEVLNVTYEFRLYISTADVTGTFVSDGVSYDTVMRPANINTNNVRMWAPVADKQGNVFYDGVLGAITAAPSGASFSQAGGYSNYLLVGDTAQIDVNLTVGVNDANFANGIRALMSSTAWHCFQISFNDPLTSKGIPKTSGQQMAVGIRFFWTRL